MTTKKQPKQSKFPYRPAIREAYSWLGFNHATFARRAGVTPETLSSVEMRRSVKPAVLEKLLSAVNDELQARAPVPELKMQDIAWEGADVKWRSREAKERGVPVTEITGGY